MRKKPLQIPHSPLHDIDVVLADLDGVVYTGANAVPFAVDSLNALHNAPALGALAGGETTMRVGYITNNASRTASAVADQLRGYGLELNDEDVVTSPQASMPLVRQLAAPGSTILVVGGEGITYELEKAGYVVTSSADDNPALVIQGFSPNVGWRELAEASIALNAGAGETPWIATNQDWTIPLERGIAPGNGSLIAAVHNAVGRLPMVAGKPEKPIFDEACRRFGVAGSPERALMIGDRLDTDIQGANRAGLKSALVLTGIDQAKQLLAATEPMRPTYILGDLRELHELYPVIDYQPIKRGSGFDSVVTVNESVVAKRGMDIVIEREGSSELDLLRAACTAIWNSGLAIFGFNVPERLYR